MPLLLLWLSSALTLVALARYAPGFEVRRPGAALLVAVVLGLLSTMLLPLLLLAAPAISPSIVGVVTLLVGTVILRFAGEVSDAVMVRGWGAAALGAGVLAALSALFHMFVF